MNVHSPATGKVVDLMKRLLIVPVVAVLMLAACGDDDDAATTKAVSATVSTAETAETTAERTTTTRRETTTTEPATTTTDPLRCSVEGSTRAANGQVCVNGVWTTATTAPRARPTTPTTTPARDGSRARPWDLRAVAEGGADVITAAKLSSFIMSDLRLGDPAAVAASNRFNTEAAPGQAWIVLTYSATVKDTVSTPVSGRDVSCSLVGDKSKVYPPASVAGGGDQDIGLLSTQEEVIGGGTLQGDVYYLVDDDDGNFMVICDGDTYFIPGP